MPDSNHRAARPCVLLTLLRYRSATQLKPTFVGVVDIRQVEKFFLHSLIRCSYKQLLSIKH